MLRPRRKIWEDLKITADGDCSQEIKRRLLLGRKVMTNLDSILKSRDMGFPGSTVEKNLPANAGDTGSIPGPGRFHMPQSN